MGLLRRPKIQLQYYVDDTPEIIFHYSLCFANFPIRIMYNVIYDDFISNLAKIFFSPNAEFY